MSASTPNSASLSSAEARPLIGVVDDDPIMGESLVQRLQLEGYQAIWWQSGDYRRLRGQHRPGKATTMARVLTEPA